LAIPATGCGGFCEGPLPPPLGKWAVAASLTHFGTKDVLFSAELFSQRAVDQCCRTFGVAVGANLHTFQVSLLVAFLASDLDQVERFLPLEFFGREVSPPTRHRRLRPNRDGLPHFDALGRLYHPGAGAAGLYGLRFEHVPVFVMTTYPFLLERVLNERLEAVVLPLLAGRIERNVDPLSEVSPRFSQENYRFGGFELGEKQTMLAAAAAPVPVVEQIEGDARNARIAGFALLLDLGADSINQFKRRPHAARFVLATVECISYPDTRMCKSRCRTDLQDKGNSAGIRLRRSSFISQPPRRNGSGASQTRRKSALVAECAK
jgi:hypothetical protein